jgi:hypothetical protein
MSEEPVDVVASVGPLDWVVLTLRDFLHRTGALRAHAIVETEPGEQPALVTCGRLEPVEVVTGERTVHMPHAIELEAEPAPLPDLRQLPPFEVAAAEEGPQITAPIGGVNHLAGGVSALAEALGGRNVAMAEFPALPPGTTLAFTARRGEKPIVTVGEDSYELD